MLQLEQLYKIIDQEAENLIWPAEPAGLYTPLKYMMDMGGKRLRPRLCLLTYNLYKDDIGSHILTPAMALEVFHNFTLIHDDIMDRADIRRGMPTVYRKWNSNTAILSGDTMCLWAFKMLNQAPKERLQEALSLFTRTTIEVCEGQQLDMDFEARDNVSLNEYINMIGLKTSVLLACAASMGAIIAGVNKTIYQGFYDFAYKLGLAFQIQDDYLDSFGEESIFGKKVGGDIINNKKTWLLIKCLEEANKDKASATKLQQLLNMDNSRAEEKIKAVKEFYCNFNIDAKALQTINSLYQEALTSLSSLNLSNMQKEQIESFAATLVTRKK